jgi:hypothetical protein
MNDFYATTHSYRESQKHMARARIGEGNNRQMFFQEECCFLTLAAMIFEVRTSFPFDRS